MPISGGDRLLLANLLKIELPSRVIRLCDGGFLDFEGERYTSHDPDFGSLGGFEVPDERAGDEAPSATMTFLPATSGAVSDLSNPAYQNSRVRFWMVELDEATGLVKSNTAELLADMRIDVPTIRVGRGTRLLEIELMGSAERLFLVNRGNTLSPRFHKSVWPGEQGFDNATGVPRQVAWGVEGPPRGVVGGGGGGGRGGDGGGGGGIYNDAPIY